MALSVVISTLLVLSAVFVLEATVKDISLNTEKRERSNSNKRDGVYGEQIIHRSKRADDAGPLEILINKQAQELLAVTAKLQAAENTIAAMQSEFHTAMEAIRNEFRAKFSALESAQGSTYSIWGKATCPNGTLTLYTGFGGGGSYKESGAGANRICLSSEPVAGERPIVSANGHLYGAEYWTKGHERTDVLCSFCHTPYSSTFMVPGTNRCPSGSHLQYHGYLSVGDSSHASASQFLCLDIQPEDRPGTTAYEDAAQLDQAIVACGSLPCPPYVNGTVATCAVCSI